jgi:hypothetical protein
MGGHGPNSHGNNPRQKRQPAGNQPLETRRCPESYSDKGNSPPGSKSSWTTGFMVAVPPGIHKSSTDFVSFGLSENDNNIERQGKPVLRRLPAR